MNLYEITNPIDPYTMRAEPPIAGLVCLLLGDGKYGLRRADSDETDVGTRVPMFAFVRQREQALEGYLTEAFGTPDLGEIVKQHREAIADAFRSVLIGSARDRVAMEKVLATISSEDDRERERTAWHDEKRSNMDDIGRRALAWAARLGAEVTP